MSQQSKWLAGFTAVALTSISGAAMAEQTIEDHKYLLELVENRAAIAYFAVVNRNLSLFLALKNYVKVESQNMEDSISESDKVPSRSTVSVRLAPKLFKP